MPGTCCSLASRTASHAAVAAKPSILSQSIAQLPSWTPGGARARLVQAVVEGGQLAAARCGTRRRAPRVGRLERRQRTIALLHAHRASQASAN